MAVMAQTAQTPVTARHACPTVVTVGRGHPVGQRYGCPTALPVTGARSRAFVTRYRGAFSSAVGVPVRSRSAGGPSLPGVPPLVSSTEKATLNAQKTSSDRLLICRRSQRNPAWAKGSGDAW
jgi:hypothetical protein